MSQLSRTVSWAPRPYPSSKAGIVDQALEVLPPLFEFPGGEEAVVTVDDDVLVRNNTAVNAGDAKGAVLKELEMALAAVEMVVTQRSDTEDVTALPGKEVGELVVIDECQRFPVHMGRFKSNGEGWVPRTSRRNLPWFWLSTETRAGVMARRSGTWVCVPM